jgi:hypothetical protein
MTLKRITDLPAAGTLTGDELLEVSQLSTTVTITATTISAAASDNSYNDSGSGFVTAGFAVGDRVKVSGFTGNTANNIFVGIVTALTTAKMTIGGTDGDVIVDDAAGESVTITKWTSRRIELDDLPGGGGNPTESIIIAVGDETTAITTGTAKVTFRMPYALTLTAVKASLTAASSSGNPTVDIKENGTSILSTNLSIDASEKTSTTATTAAVISDPDLAADAEITIGIVTAGTGAAGLKVTLIGVQP